MKCQNVISFCPIVISRSVLYPLFACFLLGNTCFYGAIFSWLRITLLRHSSVQFLSALPHHENFIVTLIGLMLIFERYYGMWVSSFSCVWVSCTSLLVVRHCIFQELLPSHLAQLLSAIMLCATNILQQLL